MAGELGTVSLGTEVDLAGLRAGLDGAKGEAESQLGNIAGGLSTVLAGAMAGAGIAGVAALAGSISQAGDFEAAVNNLAAVSGDALAQAGFSFDDVSAKALNLGQTTAFSASQSIAAMTELVKGGVPIADVMDSATEATLNLAAAGQVELASAAEIVAKQLGVWGDKGITASQVSDLLTQAANASTVGVEELAAGLANAQGTAETAGVEYQDLVQSMALLAPSFASAETAGTSMNNFLLRLQPTTEPATEAMIALGLASDDGVSRFYDVNGAFIGMEASAELLQSKLSGLTEAQKTHYLQTVFGNDAMGAAVALAGAGGEGFAAMGEAMLGAGTAASVAAVQNQGWNFALDSMKGSAETLMIVVGSALLPVLTGLLDTVITPGIGMLTSMAMALTGNADAMAGLPAPALAIIAAVQQVIAWVQQFAASLQGEGTGSLGAWGAAFTQAQDLIDGVMTAIMGIVQPILAELSAFWASHGAEIQAFAAEAWNQIGTIVSGVLAILQGTIIPILTGIGGFIAAHSADIQAILGAAWANIQAVVSGALAVIQGIVNTVLAVLRGDWSAAWTEIQGVVTTVLSTAQTIVSNTMGAIQTVWTNNLESIKGTAQTVWDGIAAILQGALDTMIGTVTGMGGRFLGAGEALITSLRDGVMGTIDGLIQDARDALQELADMLPGSEPKDPTSPLRGLSDRGAALITNFQAGIDSARLNLRPTLGAALSGLDVGGAELASSAAASANVSVQYSGRNSLLHELIDVRVAKTLAQTGRSASTRSKS